MSEISGHRAFNLLLIKNRASNHPYYPVTHVIDHRQVVGYEEDGQSS